MFSFISVLCDKGSEARDLWVLESIYDGTKTGRISAKNQAPQYRTWTTTTFSTFLRIFPDEGRKEKERRENDTQRRGSVTFLSLRRIRLVDHNIENGSTFPRSNH